MTRTATQVQKLRNRLFAVVHEHNLVYNTCWEDPALDRVALKFQPDDRVVVITSAGCNALDYLLAGAGEVNAVDMNPRQNALLEFKAAAIQGLDQSSFFELFGNGGTPQARAMYADAIRPRLSSSARWYWDRKVCFFQGKGWRNSFYFRGSSGFFAKVMLDNARVFQRLRKPIEKLLESKSVAEQREIYESSIRDRLWKPWVKWFLARHSTMSLIGVPGPQLNEIVTQYPGGLIQFVRDCVETVITRLPFADNYFWRVYLQGHYTADCCPEYVKPGNFQRLRELLPRLKIHTASVTDFLRRTKPGISKFVLLDHMDWMSNHNPQALVEEWNAILSRARPGGRVIYRSAGLQVRYLDHLRVSYRDRETELGQLLRYHPELAAELHARDRVHTYGSFYIADLPS